MNQVAQRHRRARRIAAIVAIVVVVVVAVATAATIVTDLRRLIVAAPLTVIAVGAAWVALSREGGRRAVALTVLVVAVLGIVFGALIERPRDLVLLLARAGLLVVAFFLARYALGRSTSTLKASTIEGRPVPAASRAALIMNLRSGGGKAERFALADACRARDIRAIVLQPGDDLTTLAHRAIDDGADVIGMAGGDGSQALVATVAAERGVPMVVVPAGTRNHLALDLGLDRDDVVGALDAYGAAVERTVDLADVNGRVFVNNVSLGLYAAVVSSPEYRDAKVETTLSALPGMLGPGATPFDLRFLGPDGRLHESAHLIQVSNNPYKPGSGSRPRLDTGRLGIFALELRDDRAVAALLAALAAGRPERFDGFSSWEAGTFEVASGAPIDIGLDGEAVTLDPPLLFSIRPGRLRVRLPTHAIGLSPAARKLRLGDAARRVWSTALGRTEEAL